MYKKKNKEKFNKYLRAWRAQNPEKYREIQRRSYAKRKALGLKKSSRKKFYKEWDRAWKAANRHRVRAYGALRRSRKKLGQISLSAADRAAIIALHKKAKELTLLHGEPYHVDHIQPLALGGAHHHRNMQVIRAIENLRKGARYSGFPL